MRVSNEFISKFKVVEKRESTEDQMVTDSIRAGDTIRTSRWYQMTKW
jgi:hypothetical protein